MAVEVQVDIQHMVELEQMEIQAFSTQLLRRAVEQVQVVDKPLAPQHAQAWQADQVAHLEEITEVSPSAEARGQPTKVTLVEIFLAVVVAPLAVVEVHQLEAITTETLQVALADQELHHLSRAVRWLEQVAHREASITRQLLAQYPVAQVRE